MNSRSPDCPIPDGTAGYTLLDVLLCVAIVAILAAIAVPLQLQSADKARLVEGQLALAEVVRLEDLYYASKGSYTSNLDELGFQPSSPLKHTQLFVQVRRESQTWSYMALAMPLQGDASNRDVWAVARQASGQSAAQPTVPAPLKGGGSACSFWSGWGSMEGGRIEGEESISSGSTSGSVGALCGGKRVVDHGKR